MALQHYKARAGENFPVASWLLPAKARAVILAFYDFARGADDIADHPCLPPDKKYEALHALNRVLEINPAEIIPAWAQAYIECVKRQQTPAEYGHQLLKAFMQDITQTRYESLEELLDYCRLSAVPVGRVVRHACGDDIPSAASDALCMVLQLLNHLQDVKEDYIKLNRVYLPQDWMQQAGATDAMLGQSRCASELRMVINQLLDECHRLLMLAQSCHLDQSAKRVRVEIAIIWQIAWSLSIKLRQHDPLLQRVKLSRIDYARCVGRAVKVVL